MGRGVVARWILVLGGVGFLAGFVGPMILNPWANQGPLAGLFITGPGGAVLGAVLGACVSSLGVAPATARRLLTGVAVVGAAAILYTALPEPEYEASLFDLEVIDCVPALTWRDRAISTWERRLAVNTWATPRPDWRDVFERTAADGAVVHVHVVQGRELLRARTPWNRGARMVTDWTTAPSRRLMRPSDFYVPGGCAAFPPGTRGRYLARAHDRDGYPPADPANFLDMVVLAPVPADLAGFAD